MNENVEFLNYIYQNTQMGLDTISHLISIVEESEYKAMLQSQYNEYKSIFDSAKLKLSEEQKDGKDVSRYKKMTSYIMINVKTMTNKSPSNISEMLIQGSTMGVIEITKKIKEYTNANNEIMDLAKKLLLTEQNNIEQCKLYL